MGQFDVIILSGTPVLKNGFLDLAAALFVIGGVISLIVSILALPIFSIYPLILVPFGLVFAVLFVVGLICSLVAVHCYSLTTKRSLSQAGMRGVISGAILLTVSLGLIGVTHELTTQIGGCECDNDPDCRCRLFRVALAESSPNPDAVPKPVFANILYRQ